MEYLSSMYIDNEMTLVEKQAFIDLIYSDHRFYQLTGKLLDQEKQIRGIKNTNCSKFAVPFVNIAKPLGLAAAGFVFAILLSFFWTSPPVTQPQENRFVIFQPDVRQVELTGSFNNWQRQPLRKIGSSGYWEITLAIIPGEHRFAYILDGGEKMPDPTCLSREQDDFGGENSILNIGTSI